MNGQLNEQPLVELIREVFLQRLEGALRLTHEAVKTVIYFEAGEIVYAAANLRELRLTEYIRKQGLMPAEELNSLDNNNSDLSLAAALTSRGTLDQHAVRKLIAKQVADVLRVALLWTQGKWEFEEHTHLSDPFRVKLDVPGLLLQTARKMNLQFIAKRLSNPAEIISPVEGLPDFAGLLPAEGFVISRVEGPTELSQLVLLSGLREPEALRTIYGLALAGFIARQNWPGVLKTETGRAAKTLADQTTEAVSAPVSVHTLAAELDELLARLESAASYYEILNVEATADVDDIKNNYYALARRYHPDRFHQQAGTPLHASVESAFARIAQAYVTLSDPALRSSYDSKLASRARARRATSEAPQPSKAEVSRTEANKGKEPEGSAEQHDGARAESHFQEGFVALQQGQSQAAIVNLAAAARLSPGEARFRAFYGRALSAQEGTRRLAEAEIQAAIRIDPENWAYRLMLAELYYDLGFHRRAEGELKRVMAAEPDNSAARKLLRRLESARTTT